MYLALDNVHPITLAVGNTAKRVFIIVASLVCAFCVFFPVHVGSETTGWSGRVVVDWIEREVVD